MLKYLQNRGYIMTLGIVLGLSVASFLFAFDAKADYICDTGEASLSYTEAITTYKGFSSVAAGYGGSGVHTTVVTPFNQAVFKIAENSTTPFSAGDYVYVVVYDAVTGASLATSSMVSAMEIPICAVPSACYTAEDTVFTFASDITDLDNDLNIVVLSTGTGSGWVFHNDETTAYNTVEKVPFDITINYNRSSYFMLGGDFCFEPLPNQPGEGDTLSETCPDIVLLNNECFMGQDCNIEYMYNDLFVENGGSVVVNHFGTPISWLADTPEKNLYNEAKIILEWDTISASISTGTVWHLCFDVTIDTAFPDCNFGFTEWRECEFTLTWYDKETYEAGFNEEMDQIFADYASTSPDQCENLCDEETGMIACGLKKASCWAFAPSINSQQKFVDSLLLFEKQFPYSVVNQILTLFSTTTTSFETTSTPLTLNWTTFGLPRDETLTILSENMMSDTWGDTWDTIYDIQEKIVYFFFLLFMIYFVFKSGFGADISSLFRKTPLEPTNKKDYTIDLRSRAYGTSHGTEIINLRK